MHNLNWLGDSGYAELKDEREPEQVGSLRSATFAPDRVILDVRRTNRTPNEGIQAITLTKLRNQKIASSAELVGGIELGIGIEAKKRFNDKSSARVLQLAELICIGCRHELCALPRSGSRDQPVVSEAPPPVRFQNCVSTLTRVPDSRFWHPSKMRGYVFLRPVVRLSATTG